jgi:hypothetical protein
MSTRPSQPQDSTEILQRLRGRVLGGGCPPLGSLSKEEMVAAKDLILKGEAKIASQGCALFLVAALD